MGSYLRLHCQFIPFVISSNPAMPFPLCLHSILSSVLDVQGFQSDHASKSVQSRQGMTFTWTQVDGQMDIWWMGWAVIFAGDEGHLLHDTSACVAPYLHLSGSIAAWIAAAEQGITIKLCFLAVLESNRRSWFLFPLHGFCAGWKSLWFTHPSRAGKTEGPWRVGYRQT